MLTEPRAGLLLARVCDTLEKTVLSDMAAPAAARQLKAGLWALRDLAVRLDAQPHRLSQDIMDMEAVLAQHGTGEGAVVGGPAGAASAGASAGPAGSSGDVQRHQALQEQIASLEAGLYGAGGPHDLQSAGTDKALRALYLRMLERE